MDRFARPEPAPSIACCPGLTPTVQSHNSCCQAEFRSKVLSAPTTGHSPPHSPASPGPLAVPASAIDHWPSPPGVLYRAPEHLKPEFSDPESNALSTEP